MIDDNGGSKQALSVPVFGLEIDLNGHLVPGEQDFFFLLLHFKQRYHF